MLYVTGLPYFVTGGELISCLSSPCRDLQLLVKPQLGCNRHPLRLHLSCFGLGVVSVDLFMETISGGGIRVATSYLASGGNSKVVAICVNPLEFDGAIKYLLHPFIQPAR